jgi:sarcosine oxidase subunit alpha
MTKFAPYKTSAAHAAHVALHATWHPSSVWRIPMSYGDVEREAREARTSVGLVDISDAGKIDVKGRDVDRALEALAGRELTVLRIKPGHCVVLTPRDGEAAVLRTLAGAGDCLHATEVTAAFALFGLVGPYATAVLRRLTLIDLRDKRFPPHTCASGDLAHVHASIYKEFSGSLPAFRLMVARDVGQYVWTAIVNAGKSAHLTPIGAAAAELLRGSADLV